MLRSRISSGRPRHYAGCKSAHKRLRAKFGSTLTQCQDYVWCCSRFQRKLLDGEIQASLLPRTGRQIRSACWVRSAPRLSLRPIRGEMFIEPARHKRFLLAPAERNASRVAALAGNIALRWSAGRAHNRVSINISLRWSENGTFCCIHFAGNSSDARVCSSLMRSCRPRRTGCAQVGLVATVY